MPLLSSLRPLRVVRPQCRFAALLVVAALSACTAAQQQSRVSKQGHEPAPAGRAVPSDLASPIEGGEIVMALDDQMWIVFQAKDGVHWFGSNGRGVYRFDGKRIVRFTTDHGLGGDHVQGIQGDRSGNIYVYSNPGGISRFDGRAFSTLRVADPSMNEWRLEPDDLWFPGAQESGDTTAHG